MTSDDHFDAKAAKRKLDRMRTGSPEKRASELIRPWPGMQGDIRVLYDELAFELRKNGTAPPFLKSFRIEGDCLTYQMPDWWHAARQEFDGLYEQPESEVRFEKAMAIFHDRLFLYFEGQSEIALTDLIKAFSDWADQSATVGLA